MSMSQEEAINSLIRITGRGFYDTGSVLVLEALLWHKVLSEDDLRQLLNIQPKDLRVVCSKLMEDRLIKEYKQREPIGTHNKEKEKEREREREEREKEREKSKTDDSKDGGDKEGGGSRFSFQRHITRTYYFIQYSLAIDSIKWKVDSIVRAVDSDLNKVNEKGFVCPMCKKKFTELDIQSLFNDDFTAAYCNICNTPLIEDDFSEQFRAKHQKSIKLKGQLDPILQWLKKIDDIQFLEDNNIETCFLTRVPASDTSLAVYTKIDKTGVMFDTNSYSSATNKPKNQFESATIKVNIAGDNEEEARKQEERVKMKQDKAEQNALPSWYQESTVGKQSLGKLDGDNATQRQDEGSASTTSNGAEDDKPENTVNKQSDSFAADTLSGNNNTATKTQEADELTAYYERLKAQKEQEEEEDDDDEDMDDEDFDDFEDV
ncbi:transcription factor TFIIE subunit [Saccharomycopsis crataegensis]|uniref:Transcription factor TFIIE subunit n=1 Tax=Saccharomycopsis crataegensis TaxID=43959 RepID=A0AAV5QNS5_9ASCO|nr:transcription factor TFIIE subunit [Saccharomycopsis crataegensis]